MSFKETDPSPLVVYKANPTSEGGKPKLVYLLGEVSEDEKFIVKSVNTSPKSIGKSVGEIVGPEIDAETVVLRGEGFEIKHNGTIYESVGFDEASEKEFWFGVLDMKYIIYY